MILLPIFWMKSWMNGSVHRIMLLRGLIFRVTPTKDMNSSTNLQKRPSAIIRTWLGEKHASSDLL